MNKKETTPPKLEVFEIRVEANIPCTLTYRILAENVEEAFKRIDKQPHSSFKPQILKKKLIKATAYSPGTIMIRGTKKYV